VQDWKCPPLGFIYTETPKSSYSSAFICITLHKYFFHLSLVIYFFSNFTHKTKAETAYRWEITNSKPPEPICTIDESKIGSSSQIIFMTLFFSAK
jgi:hypothetical protein